MNERQAVRLKIQDIPARADAVYQGDGTAATFALPHRNLTSASAFVPSGAAWNATGAAFDASGLVSFSGVVSSNSAFRVVYVHSVFSDAEIDHWLSVGGGVNGAAIEAVTTLMFDGLRRARWSSPDNTSVDDTAAIALLKDLYRALKDEQADSAPSGGEIVGWSE